MFHSMRSMRLLSPLLLLPSWVFPLVLIVVGWICQKTAVGFSVVETTTIKGQRIFTPSTSSMFWCRAGTTCQFLFHRQHHQPGRRRSFGQSRLSSSSSSSSSIAREKDSDDNDSLETLSKLLSRLLSVSDDDLDPHPTKHSDNPQEQEQQQQQPKPQRQRQREILTTRLSNNNVWRHLNLAALTDDDDSKGSIHINRTYVDESTISNAGKGLIAREDYPKGTLLTCYPGDALVELASDDDDSIRDGRDKTTMDTDSNVGKGRVTWGSHTTTTTTTITTTSQITSDDTKFTLRQEYMLRAICDHWGIVAVPELFDNEHLNADPSYLGHFANDGAPTPPRCESELATYTIESTDRANAMHRDCAGCHMVTVATRDIRAGEEIFVTYGPEYWSEQPSFVPSSSHEYYSEDDDDDEEEIYNDDDEEEGFDDCDYDFYDEEAEGIVTEIILSSEESSKSSSRGMGFG